MLGITRYLVFARGRFAIKATGTREVMAKFMAMSKQLGYEPTVLSEEQMAQLPARPVIVVSAAANFAMQFDQPAVQHGHIHQQVEVVL